MTDAWCHGKPCGDRVTFSGTPLNWMRFVSAGSADSTPGQCICPGCFARAQPHATGPHTRIVEEWEHEYGALCRVVVGPYIARDPDTVEVSFGDDDMDVWRRWSLCPCVAPCVGGRLGTVRFLRDGREAAMAGAHTDAERLALEWSPPIDGEAA